MRILGPGDRPTREEILPLAEAFADDPDDAERLTLVKRSLSCGGPIVLESFTDESDENFSHVYLRCSEVSEDPMFVGVIDERTGIAAKVAT